MTKTVATLRVLILPLLLAQAPADAIAGAWTSDEGHGQVIVTTTFTRSTRQFDGNGNAVPIPTFDKLETNALIEYGLTPWLTAIAQPQLRRTTIDEPTNAFSSGFGYTELGGRARLWSGGNSVFSVQAIARVPGQSDPDNLAEMGYSDPEYDMRALAGHSFKLGTWDAFVDGQFGYRIRTRNPSNEVRLDFTLGVRPAAEYLILLQSFNNVADGTASGAFENTHEHKLSLNAVWDFTKDWSVQVGGIATVAGEYALRERGVIGGLWHRF
jgi:protein XagA